jgi:hypothetical protein
LKVMKKNIHILTQLDLAAWGILKQQHWIKCIFALSICWKMKIVYIFSWIFKKMSPFITLNISIKLPSKPESSTPFNYFIFNN